MRERRKRREQNSGGRAAGCAAVRCAGSGQREGCDVLPVLYLHCTSCTVQARGCVKAAMDFRRADDDVGADRVLRRGGDEVHRYLSGDFALSLQVRTGKACLCGPCPSHRHPLVPHSCCCCCSTSLPTHSCSTRSAASSRLRCATLSCLRPCRPPSLRRGQTGPRLVLLLEASVPLLLPWRLWGAAAAWSCPSPSRCLSSRGRLCVLCWRPLALPASESWGRWHATPGWATLASLLPCARCCCACAAASSSRRATRRRSRLACRCGMLGGDALAACRTLSPPPPLPGAWCRLTSERRSATGRPLCRSGSRRPPALHSA